MNRHARVIKLGLDADPVHASKLIAEYASSPTLKSLSQVQQVFEQVPFTLRDTALWASLISAYSRSNQPRKALYIFSDMLRQHSLDPAPNTRPNSYVFTSVTRAITSVPEQVSLGQALHAHEIKEGVIPQGVFVGTALVDMYGKCGAIECASKLFDEMPQRNLVTWNAILSGFVRNGMEKAGLVMFRKMTDSEVYMPDEFTVATVLTGCTELQDLVFGMQVHGYAIIRGFELNCLSSIANMYFYCGEVESAEKVSNGIEDDVFLKLTKIRGHVFNYNYQCALKCISSDKYGVIEMLYWDHTLIIPLLSACTKLSLLKVGKQLHGLFIILTDSCASVNSLEDSAYVGCALIDMYSKCDDVVAARRVFDSWLSIRDISHGNAMIAGYIYNGLIEDARTIFETMPEKNVISWTSMMMGYVRSGWPDEGLNILTRMHFDTEGFMVRGNGLTFVVGLEACSYLTDLEKGKQIHAKIVRTLTSADISNVVVGTALVDTYSKSGNLHYAQKVFDLMMEKNVVAWTSIIMGYAVHGFCFDALKVFQQMICTGIEPNQVTFIALLTACSHGGFVVEGLQYFKMMVEKYNLVPEVDHYTCIIDMLGRFGRLDEAWNLLQEIEEREASNGCPTSTAWAALLGACHLYGNVELGERVAKKIECRTQMSSMHVALSNVYSASGMWIEAYAVRQNWRKEGSITGEPGLSRIYGS